MPSWLFRVMILSGLTSACLNAQVATRAAMACSRTGDYVDLAGADTVGVSLVTITDSSVESTTRAVGQGGLLHFHGQRNVAGGLAALHVEIWSSVADSAGPPTQIADLQVLNDEVVAHLAAPSRGLQEQRDRKPPGGVLYMARIPLFLELLQRHVRVPIGSSTRVPVLWLFSGGAVDTVRVSRLASDTITIRFPDVQYVLERAPDGSILSASGSVLFGAKGRTSQLLRRDCR